MKILIVEDEAKTAAYLRKGLTENKYQVEWANNGTDGTRMATTGVFDLVILDVLLPQCSGWSVLSKMRSNNQKTPVLFLSACDSVTDRVKGLELGADDYLVKPFAFSELLARIRTLLRRTPAPQEKFLQFSDLILDLIHMVAKRGDIQINLAPKEFKLLSLLTQHSEEILTRKQIAKQVWNIDFDTNTNMVDVAIRRLRSKADDPFDHKLIHAVRGVGYVLEER
ncbi:heavy metal response regulator transcription factor [Sedimenticola sp.]|uniref:heavy metal response regulator transcription factor n=1 Tax=Sedimenticola sp. TaxID=1940285 RepID=UPI00258CB7D2|nr:heavy metal response regulator transcription factor [Sedimenticola sp.]MCW8902693.1 heavy metal response regulator transcription factor [Sedimenticola sp.]